MGEKQQDEIEVTCYNEKADFFIGCCICVEKGWTVESLGTEWIEEGCEESFWENSRHIEAEIEKINERIEKRKAEYKDNEVFDSDEEYAREIRKLFGHFRVEWEVNNQKVDLDFGIDMEKLAYDLISRLKDL